MNDTPATPTRFGQIESDLTWENIALAIEDAPRVLAAVRENTGASLRDVAAEIGVIFTLVHRFERGGQVRMEALVKILRWLGRNADGDE